MTNEQSILLVEDDNLMIRLYQEKFSQDGFEVDVALNGEEGLAKLKEKKPILVLLDVMMPKMDGFEMLKRIKADPETKSVPVILLTNLSGEEDAKKGLELGAVAYLIKSDYTPDEIVAKVKEIMAGHSRGKGVPKAAERE